MTIKNITKDINCTQVNGINIFIEKDKLSGENQRFAKLYNKIAPFYNISARVFYRFKFGSEQNFRNEFLNRINIKDGDLVLETSVGTADNLRFLNKNAQYVGVDISDGMLRRAVSHVKRWGVSAEFVCCEAESLPFKDNVFDVVYSCGGINFYNDKRKAIEEMIRVAKPGTELFIIDETEKTVKEVYKNVPGKELYDRAKAEMPIDLIPADMLDICGDVVCKGYMYIISFKKPE